MTTPKALTPYELRGKALVYLVDLEFAGRTFRLATTTTSVLKNDGTSVLYRGDLRRLKFTDALGMWGDDAPRRSMPLEVKLPVDVATLIARGHTLERAPVTLYLWISGRTWEQRIPLLAGRLREAEYDEDEGTVVGRVVDEPTEDGALWPPTTQIIDDATWPDADGPAVGRPYPTVIGSPAAFVSIAGTSIIVDGAMQAYLANIAVGTNYLLIAGHEIYTATVQVNRSDGTNIGVKTIVPFPDGRGQLTSVVLLSDADAGSPDFGYDFFVSWVSDGGGVFADSGAGTARKALRNLGDVTCWALRRSGLRVDWSCVEAGRDRLNRWSVDACIEERVNLFRWLRQGPFVGLPIWTAGGPRGIRVGCWLPEDAPTFHFRAPVDGHRVEAKYERDDLHNVRRTEFALVRQSDTHRQAVLVTGQPWTGARGEIPTSYAEASRGLYGEREGESRANDHTADRNVVSDAALLEMRQLALGRRGLVYRARPGWAWLLPGMVGSVTDPALALEEARCLCRGITYGDATVEVDFVVLNDLPGARATA